MTANLGLRLGLYSTTAGLPACSVSDVVLVDAWVVDIWAVDASASKSASLVALLRSAMNTMLPTCHDEMSWMDMSMASCYLDKR